MRTARDVLEAIDDATVLYAAAPVLGIRMAAAGCNCNDLTVAHALHQAGLPSRFIAFLDNPATARKARQRHAQSKRARAARRMNRRRG